MPSLVAAVAVAMAIYIVYPEASRAEMSNHRNSAPVWRNEDTLSGVIAALDDWLDENSEWSRRVAPPRIRQIGHIEAKAMRIGNGSMQRGRLRGLYDPEREEILLVRPWNPKRAEDVAVLLHELVHHRQAPHHWYCHAAQELAAYRLQDQWMSENGVRAQVNWIAVIMDASCAPRDIHPD